MPLLKRLHKICGISFAKAQRTNSASKPWRQLTSIKRESGKNGILTISILILDGNCRLFARSSFHKPQTSILRHFESIWRSELVFSPKYARFKGERAEFGGKSRNHRRPTEWSFKCHMSTARGIEVTCEPARVTSSLASFSFQLVRSRSALTFFR